jgi:hypothetical protein
MTILNKPVRRILRDDVPRKSVRKPIAITLEPHGVLILRLKGQRIGYPISVERVFWIAAEDYADGKRSERKKRTKKR